MFSLPQEYWDESTLQEIGNTLGSFVRTSDQTRINKFTSYARICVFMHIAQAIPDAICLSHEDNDWIQPLDYEHIPFRCRKCHEHGHLFRDCPLNKVQEKFNSPITDEQGFQYTARKKHNHKRSTQEKLPEQPPSTKNSFQVLDEVNMDQEKIIEDKNLNQEVPMQLHVSKTADNSILQPSEQSPGKSSKNPNDTQDRVHLDIHMPDQNPKSLEEEDMKDTIPEGLDLIGLEDACTRKDFKYIPTKQI